LKQQPRLGKLDLNLKILQPFSYQVQKVMLTKDYQVEAPLLCVKQRDLRCKNVVKIELNGVGTETLPQNTL
jgi:hypothetical protein